MIKYMGSKRRLAKHILPIILKDRDPGQWYVEPFVGGGNMIENVYGNRIGADSNEFLIAALKLIRDTPELLPDLVTEDDYNKARQSEAIPAGLKGYIGFAMSFGGKFFGGYRRDKAGTAGDIGNMETQSRRSKSAAIKQSELIKEVKFVCKSYEMLVLPPNCIVYCDPPYENATKYKDDFDHDKFWEWVRETSKNNHQVFVSEYSAPDDFECVWEMDLSNTLSKNGDSAIVAKERLFVHKSSLK